MSLITNQYQTSLRLEDYGKMAATFIDVKTERAVRVAPALDVRELAYAYAPGERRHYFAQLTGYQVMPDDELLTVTKVSLNRPVAEIVSRPGVRVNCARCGEEIVNEREVIVGNETICISCVGPGYYEPVVEDVASVTGSLDVPATRTVSV